SCPAAARAAIRRVARRQPRRGGARLQALRSRPPAWLRCSSFRPLHLTVATTRIVATIKSMSNTESKLQGCTNFKLRQLARRVSQRYDAEVGKAGLKTTQYSLLTHVLKLGPIRPG